MIREKFKLAFDPTAAICIFAMGFCSIYEYLISNSFILLTCQHINQSIFFSMVRKLIFRIPIADQFKNLL